MVTNAPMQYCAVLLVVIMHCYFELFVTYELPLLEYNSVTGSTHLMHGISTAAIHKVACYGRPA